MAIDDMAVVEKPRVSVTSRHLRLARNPRSPLAALAGVLVVALPLSFGAASTGAAKAAAARNAPPCSAHQLSATGSWGGATQFQFGGVGLSSWSDQYCVLRGYVSVQISAQGRPLAVKEVHDLHLTGQRIKSPPTVLFPPGQARYAGFDIQWENWCGAARGPFSVELALPNHQRLPLVDTTELSSIHAPPSCLEHSKPSEILVQPIVVRATAYGSLVGVVNKPTVKIGSFSGVLPEWISFSGDANNHITALNWIAWNERMAEALGIWGYDDCKPDCAGGTSTPYPTLITLSDPINGSFTKISENQSGQHGRSYSFALPNTFLTAGVSATGQVTGSSPPASPPVVSCQPSDLTVAVGAVQGTAQQWMVPLKFTNRSPAACSVSGFPTLSFVNGVGQTVGMPIQQGRDGISRSITLGQGESALAEVWEPDTALLIDNGESCSPTPWAAIRVASPAQAILTPTQGAVSQATTTCTTGHSALVVALTAPSP